MRRVTITAATPMPWGEHAGTPFGEVPSEYLFWLRNQPWIRDWPDIHAYLLTLKFEAPPEERQSTTGFTSLDEYMRYGRD